MVFHDFGKSNQLLSSVVHLLPTGIFVASLLVEAVIVVSSLRLGFCVPRPCFGVLDKFR